MRRREDRVLLLNSIPLTVTKTGAPCSKPHVSLFVSVPPGILEEPIHALRQTSLPETAGRGEKLSFQIYFRKRNNYFFKAKLSFSMKFYLKFYSQHKDHWS
jgi:hypothetical protein